jgi:cytochrome c553
MRKLLVRHSRRLVAGMLLAMGAATTVFAQTPDTAAVAAGRRMYDEGVLASGAKLEGHRSDGTVATGQAAACTNCHRPSGMGSVEGDIQVAPITGRFLFPQDNERPLAAMDPRIGKRMSLKREPHTDESLAIALRTGKGSNGQELSPLMPRYTLNDADMARLTAYLKQLSTTPSPGVDLDEHTIRFATVITPGVEPHRKKALLEMMRIAIMQKNGSTIVGNGGRRHMVTAAELVLGTENKWVLDVWELHGAPETWGAQLKEFNRLAPPFALVSGLGTGTWAPVEAFCETEHVPCWFPSVESVPQHSEQPRYAFYFNRGLPLEADVLASYLKDQKPTGQLVQIVRGSDSSLQTAQALNKRTEAIAALKGLKSSTIDLDQLQQGGDLNSALAQRLAGLRASDTLVLWLRPVDLRLIEGIVSGVPAKRYASGTLLSATAAFMPESLRPNTSLIYPYEMPMDREANVGYMHVWLKLRRIALVDEALQSEVYFALNFLTDSMAELLDNLYRDYLVERAENMIGQRESRKAEDEMRDQSLVRPRAIRRVPMNGSIPQPVYAAGAAEHMAGKREGTTIYPRLTLGPGQRYASKGAYIVHYDNSDAGLIVADTPWLVP